LPVCNILALNVRENNENRRNFLRNILKTVLPLSALLLAVASIGSAATASGTVPFSFTGVTDNTPGALVPGTQFTVASVAASGDGSGSFDSCPSADCVASGSPATIVPSSFFGDAMIGLVLTFGPAGTRYQYTVTSQDAPVITHPGTGETFYDIVTNGTFVDNASVFDSAAASLELTFTETCTSGCSISGAASFGTPPAVTTTPEPVMLLLTGLALLGVGLLRRRSSPI